MTSVYFQNILTTPNRNPVAVRCPPYPPSAAPSPRQLLICFLTLDLPYTWNRPRVAFCDWPPSLCRLSSSFTHVAAYVSVSLLFMAEEYSTVRMDPVLLVIC